MESKFSRFCFYEEIGISGEQYATLPIVSIDTQHLRRKDLTKIKAPLCSDGKGALFVAVTFSSGGSIPNTLRLTNFKQCPPVDNVYGFMALEPNFNSFTEGYGYHYASISGSVIQVDQAINFIHDKKENPSFHEEHLITECPTCPILSKSIRTEFVRQVIADEHSFVKNQTWTQCQQENFDQFWKDYEQKTKI